MSRLEQSIRDMENESEEYIIAKRRKSESVADR